MAEDALRLSAIRKSFNLGSPAEVEILLGIDLTREHASFCALIGPSGSGKSTLLNIIALLERVGMARWREARVANLSGGQAQRVSIARALMMQPVLVLADEPTGNLDTASADGVFDMMHEMNKEEGMTFLIVTHDQRLAKRCGRIIELVDGQITAGTA